MAVVLAVDEGEQMPPPSEADGASGELRDAEFNEDVNVSLTGHFESRVSCFRLCHRHFGHTYEVYKQDV